MNYRYVPSTNLMPQISMPQPDETGKHDSSKLQRMGMVRITILFDNCTTCWACGLSLLSVRPFVVECAAFRYNLLSVRTFVVECAAFHCLLFNYNLLCLRTFIYSIYYKIIPFFWTRPFRISIQFNSIVIGPTMEEFILNTCNTDKINKAQS